NLGYDATINRIRARLTEAGFQDRPKGTTGPLTTSSTWVEEYPNPGKGWRFTVGTLAIEHGSAPEEIVLSRDQTNPDVCINSFSTPPDGVVAPLVDVGAGSNDAAYADKDLTGAIVLGDADVGQIWRRAMAKGARGVISTSLGGYVTPDLANAAVKTPKT